MKSFGREDWLHQTESGPGSDFICNIPHHSGFESVVLCFVVW